MSVQQTFRNTVTVILTLAAAYVLLLSARILIVLLIAIIVASAIRPAVLRLEKWRFPEAIAILIVYLIIGILLLLLSAGVLPPVVSQFTGYLNNEQGLASRIITAQNWFEQQLANATGHEVTLFNEDAIRNAVSNTVDK